MEYILTTKRQYNKRCNDNKCRSYIIYFLNGVEILKHKSPYEEDYQYGYNHRTHINNVYLFNNKIYQVRTKYDVRREVYYPVSKSKLKLIGVPSDIKIEEK